MVVNFPPFVPKGADAITIWPFVFTRPGIAPKHLIEHERVHLRQQIKFALVGFAVLYFMSKRWRYRFELEAYRVSVKHGLPIHIAAKHLSGPLYGNIVTYGQAMHDLALPY